MPTLKEVNAKLPELKASPRVNPKTGAVADFLKYLKSPKSSQQMQGLMGALPFVDDLEQVLDRVSYGEPLTTGQGMTTALRPEAKGMVELATIFAPGGRLAKDATVSAIRSTKGMPVGMSINDVGKSIFEDATKYHQKVPEIKSINLEQLKRMNAGEVADVSDEVAAAMDFSTPIQVSVFADGDLRIVDGHHRVAAAKKLGMKSLPVKLQAINAKGSMLNKLAQEQDPMDTILKTLQK